mmetsp:Transcript_38753/g.109580  ORF Transcript_38753/g.109580 Transcript_38753/m.109580 type:complete len:231 (-) Transcript_38753:1173-1865(-)
MHPLWMEFRLASRWQNTYLIDEFLQEETRGDGPSEAAPSVDHVCDGALELLHVLALKRQPPDLLACGLGGRCDPLSHVLVGGHQPSDAGAQRHYAGSGQRGHIDDSLSLALLLCKEKCICQCEATLRVGVVHLNSLAVGGSDDITGAEALSVDHVLTRRDDEMHLNVLGSQASSCHRCSEGGTRATHVKLHLLNHRARPGLQVVAATVKSESLAHHCDLALGIASCRRVC